MVSGSTQGIKGEDIFTFRTWGGGHHLGFQSEVGRVHVENKVSLITLFHNQKFV